MHKQSPGTLQERCRDSLGSIEALGSVEGALQGQDWERWSVHASGCTIRNVAAPGALQERGKGRIGSVAASRSATGALQEQD